MATIINIEGLIFIVLGLLGIYDGFRLNKISAIANQSFGPGLYLIALSIFMFIGGAYFIISDILNKDKIIIKYKFKIGPALLAILALVAYSILVKIVGYPVSTALFILATILIFGEQSWIRAIIIPVIAAVVFWLVFVYVGGIPLPRSILGF